MSGLQQKIQNDLRHAFKQGETLRVATLRMVQAAIHNAEIEKRKKLWESRDSQSPERSEGRSEAARNTEGVSRGRGSGATEDKPTKEERLRTDEGLSDDEILEVIGREVKRRKEASELYEKGGRGDLAEKEKNEAALLEVYLPERLSEGELQTIIQEILNGGEKNTGKVMGMVMGKAKGRADGTVVRKMVEEMIVNEKSKMQNAK